MIKKEFRVSKKHFPAVLKGPSINGTYFRVIVSPSISNNPFNCGVILSKKYVKKAATRNLIRRSVFRIISQYSTVLPKKTYIFNIIKQIPIEKGVLSYQNTYIELEKDIKNIIDQINKKYAKNI